jgi:hypothetical protein
LVFLFAAIEASSIALVVLDGGRCVCDGGGGGGDGGNVPFVAVVLPGGQFTNVKLLFRQRFDACVNKSLIK